MRYSKLFYAILIGAIVAIGCGMGNEKKITAADEKPAAAAATTAKTATTGSIKGLIKLEGTAPKGKKLNMNADPVCAKSHSAPVLSENVVVGAGGELAHVIVYVTDEVAGEHPVPTTSAVLDQKGCMYTPHVFGLFDGQKLEIRNSDKTLHNVHCYKGTSTCFNRAMFQGMAPIKHEFKEKGEIVKFKCDVHPWMTAYALIAKNPFFATTGKDGAFEIKNLPAGKYTIKAWHEKFGDQTLEVTVAAGAAADANVTFKAGS